jgi:hypothetical protein
MKALSALGFAMAASVLLPVAANAQSNKGTHLHTSGQSKVNKAMAKGYLQSGATQMQQNQSQVNIGSKRGGTCNMNVGAPAPGSKQNPKEVIVTSKEIINICK